MGFDEARNCAAISLANQIGMRFGKVNYLAVISLANQNGMRCGVSYHSSISLANQSEMRFDEQNCTRFANAAFGAAIFLANQY